MSEIVPEKKSLFHRVYSIIDNARNSVIRTINSEMVIAYWNIRPLIVEEEQSGKKRAEYGRRVLKELSAKLTNKYGGSGA
jgi:hypothetical protein